MPDGKSIDSRPLVDTLLLVAVCACLCIALVRVALVAATVPYAYYVSRRASVEAKAAGVAPPDVTIAERVAGSAPFTSWWGERRVPYRAGGDYLAVISHHSAARTLGCAIGYTAEKESPRGVIKRVIVPSDRVALYGEESGTLMTRADGTEFRSYWAPPAQDSALFSNVPVVEQDYDPVLTPGQAARVDSEAGLSERAREFFVGKPPESGSGTWKVYVRLVAGGREFLLIPVESSPAGAR